MNNKLSSYNETRGIYQKMSIQEKRIKSFLTLSNNVDLLVTSYWRTSSPAPHPEDDSADDYNHEKYY